MALDEIDRESALVSCHDLRLALTRLDGARHSLAMAAAGSDLCDATMATTPELRVVQGGKR